MRLKLVLDKSSKYGKESKASDLVKFWHYISDDLQTFTVQQLIKSISDETIKNLKLDRTIVEFEGFQLTNNLDIFKFVKDSDTLNLFYRKGHPNFKAELESKDKCKSNKKTKNKDIENGNEKSFKDDLPKVSEPQQNFDSIVSQLPKNLDEEVNVSTKDKKKRSKGDSNKENKKKSKSKPTEVEEVEVDLEKKLKIKQESCQSFMDVAEPEDVLKLADSYNFNLKGPQQPNNLTQNNKDASDSENYFVSRVNVEGDKDRDIVKMPKINYEILPNVNLTADTLKQGQVIAFKLWYMNEFYQPTQTDFVEAEVVGYDDQSEHLSFKYIYDNPIPDYGPGKFDLDEVDEEFKGTEDGNRAETVVTYHIMMLLDLKLVR